MELVSLGLEALQRVAEHAASYRAGQSVLRYCDRALWVVEKCARWAVPPPLDQDERPPLELVRPLPWVFFLMMLITLRVVRESISLANLIMGKPPLRSADVVVFIQSRRRYLRTLKYQGSRMLRARTSTQPQRPWYSGLLSLFELTMCFRRQSLNYGNNNTTRVTINDEVVVIKRSKRGRSESPSVASAEPAVESTMERLIEKMMVNLDAESDDDSAITLTDATSPKTDRSECTESDQDTICETSTPVRNRDSEISQTNGDDIHFSPNKKQYASSTPEKQENHIDNDTGNQTFQISYIDGELDKTVTENSSKTEEKRKLEENVTESAFTNENTKNNEETNYKSIEADKSEDSALPTVEESLSPTQESQNFINNEAAQYSRKTPKKEPKIANGRTVKSVPGKRKGANLQHRRGSNEALPQRVLPSHSSF